MTRRRLILLGGGHAHIHTLARAARVPLAGVELILISPFGRHHYSGMVPGFLQGSYREDELAFDLCAIAKRAGARFIEAAVEHIDARGRTVQAGGERLEFDLLSLDVGSEPAGLALLGVRAHAMTVRPMSRAVALRQRAEAVFSGARNRQVAVVVVGGGAAGLEVALAFERLGRERGSRPAVTIIESAARVLPEYSARASRVAESVLGAHGIRFRLGQQVCAVEPGGVVLEDGSTQPSELTVWLVGAAPSRLILGSDLPKDPRGYLLVDDTLRAIDGSPIFGAGDCIGIVGHPQLAKAGVYAVRESPVLDHNLRAALLGGAPRHYRPQESFLALMNTADGRAIWRWHGLVGHSRLAWWTKNRIDRAFVRRYQEL